MTDVLRGRLTTLYAAMNIVTLCAANISIHNQRLSSAADCLRLITRWQPSGNRDGSASGPG